MKRKKIGFITPMYLPAAITGSGVVVKELAEAFVQNGYDVSVITSDSLTGKSWYDPFNQNVVRRPMERINGVIVYRLPCNQFVSSASFVLTKYFPFLFFGTVLDPVRVVANGPSLRHMTEVLERECFDVLHCSPFPLYINIQTIQAVSKLKNKPKLIFTPFFHSHVSLFSNRYLQHILERADYVHVISQAEKREIMSTFHIHAQRIKTIPLFLSTQHVSTVNQLQPQVINFKKKHRLIERKIVLFSGTKGSMKGIDYLARVMKHLYSIDSSYILVTMGNDTAQWSSIKKSLSGRCLLDLPYMKGKDKEIVYACCNVLCIPSLSETFGMAYLEAWHKKKPVIGADIPAVRELIVANSGGLVIDYPDEGALADAIVKLTTQAGLSKKYGENGYNALVKKYTLAGVFASYQQLFNV